MHPSDILFQGKRLPVSLPVCDHYAVSEQALGNSLTPRSCSHGPVKPDAAPHEIQALSVVSKAGHHSLGVGDSELAHRSAAIDSVMGSPDSSGHLLATRAKMKIGATSHAFSEIAPHNGCSKGRDPSALTCDAIKAIESRRLERESILHSRESDRSGWTVLQKAKRSGQSMPEAAGAPM